MQRNGEPKPLTMEPIELPDLRCVKCEDHYLLRDSMKGLFLAASQYPKNRETRAPKVHEIKDLKDQLMRTLADSENLRKRTIKEVEHAKKYIHITFVRDLVSSVDNLQRALESVPDDKSQLPEPVKNLIIGLDIVEKEIVTTFEKHNLKQICPLGEKFDYNFHQAMFEVPTNDSEPGIVVEVSQKGYLLPVSYTHLTLPTNREV